MKKHTFIPLGSMAFLVSFILSTAERVWAYPPAPPHEIYGMVRDEDGEPFDRNNVELVLETMSGVKIPGVIAPSYKAGVNYYITIPMDAALTPEPYLDHALKPQVPFLIKVIEGSVTNIPLEMSGDYSRLGQVGDKTRINLTLGVDSDGDELPDAWENLIISMLGNGLTLADITKNSDSDGDGMSDGDEYLAGTYAFDNQDIFHLHLMETTTNSMMFGFLGIKGRSYHVEASSNLTNWAEIPFQIPTLSEDAALDFYSAPQTGLVEIKISSTNSAIFYRGRVQ